MENPTSNSCAHSQIYEGSNMYPTRITLGDFHRLPQRPIYKVINFASYFLLPLSSSHTVFHTHTPSPTLRPSTLGLHFRPLLEKVTVLTKYKRGETIRISSNTSRRSSIITQFHKLGFSKSLTYIAYL